MYILVFSVAGNTNNPQFKRGSKTLHFTTEKNESETLFENSGVPVLITQLPRLL